MLRVSMRHAGLPLEVAAVERDDIDPGVPGASEILAFVTVLVRRDDEALPAARAALVEVAGPEVAGLLATTTGNFEMMNRILDATGVPVR